MDCSQSQTGMPDCIPDDLRGDFLSENKLRGIQVLEELGEGGHGTVELISLEGELMVLKTLKGKGLWEKLLHEIRMHKRLAGAGGAPLLHGLALHPPRILMSCAGKSYVDYALESSDRRVVHSLAVIARKLSEIHRCGVVHNDFKADNVTVTTGEEVDFHVIDFGMSVEEGEVLQTFADPEKQFWMAPEVLAWEPNRPASDVYSFGQMIGEIITHCIEDYDVKLRLQPLYLGATVRDPLQRPTLQDLALQLQQIALALPEEPEQ